MGYKSFVPCEDWFYVGSGDDGKPIIFRLAGWGVREEDGGIIGLISPWPVEQGVPKLVTPPPAVKGLYKHARDLTERERELAQLG